MAGASCPTCSLPAIALRSYLLWSILRSIPKLESDCTGRLPEVSGYREHELWPWETSLSRTQEAETQPGKCYLFSSNMWVQLQFVSLQIILISVLHLTFWPMQRFCTVEAEGGPERNECWESQSSILKGIEGMIRVSRGGSEQMRQHGAVPRGRGTKARLQRISGKRTRIQAAGFKP